VNEISELNVYNPHSGVSGEISESPARLKNPDRLRVSALKHPPPSPRLCSDKEYVLVAPSR